MPESLTTLDDAPPGEVEETAPPGAERPGRRRPHLPRRLTAWRPGRPGALTVLLLVAALLAGSTVYLGLQLRAHDQRDHQGKAAVDAASQIVTLLWTVDAASSQDVFATLMAGSTGDLRQQMSASSGTFQQVLTTQKVSSTATVVQTGLTDLHGTTATALVAVNATVTSAKGDSSLRQYRMKATVDRVGGRWLVSDLEFVA